MMSNPKTTILGWAAIATAVIAFVTKLLQNQPVTLDEAIALISAIGAGAIGINAKDGSL